MSWDVSVRKITAITPIENADSIELAIIGNGWPCVVKKGVHQVGELVTYIPVDSLVPDTLLATLGLQGKLSGSRRNRVKAVRLRGQTSIGILAPVPPGKAEGDDVANYYGIMRWEQDIPACLAGTAKPRPQGFIKYDVDNINNEDWLIDGEEVVITEKLHGTNVAFGIVNNEFVVCSRSMSLIEDSSNLYWKIAREYNIEAILRAGKLDDQEQFWLHGEIFGKGVQDLTYGLDKPHLAIFDMRTNNGWLDYVLMHSLAQLWKLPLAPRLYTGPYSKAIVDQFTDGKETYSGFSTHMREGCVIKPVVERVTYRGQRVILKSVSKEYLLRKNGTEFH